MADSMEPRAAIAVVLGLLAAAGCGDGSQPAEPAPPAPDRPGPWAVGRTTVSLVDSARDRTLVTDIWYPAPAGTTGDRAGYDFFVTQVPSDLAIQDAPIANGGPLPLVVFSHGATSLRYTSWFVCEALASHGFVVASADHPGDTALDLLGTGELDLEASQRERPRDTTFLIDQLVERSENPGDRLNGALDASRVAVSGHSLGGYTALAAAIGGGGAPPDPRVDAIVLLSAAYQLFSDDDLGQVATPSLLVGGTAENVLIQTARPWGLIPGSPSVRVVLEGGAHNTFTNLCAIEDALAAAGFPGLLGEAPIRDACGSDRIPSTEGHRLTSLYAVSFLKVVLEGDTRYERYLDPRWTEAHEPRVEHFAR